MRTAAVLMLLLATACVTDARRNKIARQIGCASEDTIAETWGPVTTEPHRGGWTRVRCGVETHLCRDVYRSSVYGHKWSVECRRVATSTASEQVSASPPSRSFATWVADCSCRRRGQDPRPSSAAEFTRQALPPDLTLSAR